jgi:acyl carrier protein
MAPETIEPDAPLFGDGLGLDSIDALEISLEVAKQYGIEIKAEDERNEHIFASLRSLAAFVAQHSAR